MWKDLGYIIAASRIDVAHTLRHPISDVYLLDRRRGDIARFDSGLDHLTLFSLDGAHMDSGGGHSPQGGALLHLR